MGIFNSSVLSFTVNTCTNECNYRTILEFFTSKFTFTIVSIIFELKVLLSNKVINCLSFVDSDIPSAAIGDQGIKSYIVNIPGFGSVVLFANNPSEEYTDINVNPSHETYPSKPHYSEKPIVPDYLAQTHYTTTQTFAPKPTYLLQHQYEPTATPPPHNKPYYTSNYSDHKPPSSSDSEHHSYKPSYLAHLHQQIEEQTNKIKETIHNFSLEQHKNKIKESLSDLIHKDKPSLFTHPTKKPLFTSNPHYVGAPHHTYSSGSGTPETGHDSGKSEKIEIGEKADVSKNEAEMD